MAIIPPADPTTPPPQGVHFLYDDICIDEARSPFLGAAAGDLRRCQENITHDIDWAMGAMQHDAESHA